MDVNKNFEVFSNNAVAIAFCIKKNNVGRDFSKSTSVTIIAKRPGSTRTIFSVLGAGDAVGNLNFSLLAANLTFPGVYLYQIQEVTAGADPVTIHEGIVTIIETIV